MSAWLSYRTSWSSAVCLLNNADSVYLARHRLSVVEQVVFLHFSIFCLQLGRLSALGIVQQNIYLTDRPKQTSQETLEKTKHKTAFSFDLKVHMHKSCVPLLVVRVITQTIFMQAYAIWQRVCSCITINLGCFVCFTATSGAIVAVGYSSNGATIAPLFSSSKPLSPG